MANIRVSVKKEGSTIVVKINRYVESFDAHGMSRFEIIDRVRWISITSGTSISKDTRKRLLAEAEAIA